jgi:hypothetical protein
MDVNIIGGLLIMLALAGNGANDAAAYLDPADYLKAHHVELKAKDLAALVNRSAKDGEGQMKQLLAIRWLATHPDEVRPMREVVLDNLRAVAEGKEGHDTNGLAREHAARALARLEGTSLPPGRPIPADSVRAEGLRWFPAEANMLVAIDLRAPPTVVPVDSEELSRLLAVMVPPRDWRGVYDFVDQVGNFRLDRVSLAFELEKDRPGPKRIWTRFTGAGDARALEKFMAKELPERQERKGPRGEAIVVLTRKEHAPACAFFGNTDFLVVGYLDEGKNHLEVLDALLDVSAGKARSALAGAFADDLKKVGPRAQGLFVVELLGGFGLELAHALDLTELPKQVLVETTSGKVFQVRVRGRMKDNEEAAKLAEKLRQFQHKAKAELKRELPPDADVSPKLVEVMREVVEGIKIEVDGPTVVASAQVKTERGNAVLQAIRDYHLKKEPKRP